MRSGRPRGTGERNAKGKLRPLRRLFDHSGVRAQRIQMFGVTDRQAHSPLSSFLAGVLYLRGQITYDELVRFIGFLRMMRDLGPRAIVYGEKVQGVGRDDVFLKVRGEHYHHLVKKLGRKHMDILHELANDRLVCPIKVLRRTLSQVPLTTVTFQV